MPHSVKPLNEIKLSFEPSSNKRLNDSAISLMSFDEDTRRNMSKKICVISSTMRKGGNSYLLAQEFARGAKEAGNEVLEIDIKTLELKYCLGCMYCQSHDGCVIKDSMNSLYREIQNSDVLVFATPIYYYSVSGQLKTFIDRLNPLYPKDNKFKEVYLLATSAEDETSAMDGAIKCVQGFIDCFDNVTLKGVVCGTGVEGAGEIKNSDALLQAYEAGEGV